jgi:hypothetical protein
VLQSERIRTEQTRRGFLAKAMAAVAVLGTCAQRARGATVKTVQAPFDLSFLDGPFPLMRRDAWTTDPPRIWLLREGGDFDRITVHHQGGRQSISRVQNAVAAEIDAVYGGHRRQKYGDIAYHFVVDYAGRVWEGRSLAYQGAHVSHQNARNLGILLLGNFEQQSPSSESITAISELVPRLRDRFGIKRHRLYGHRDLGASACPGKHLYPHVVALREGDGGTIAALSNKQGKQHDS